MINFNLFRRLDVVLQLCLSSSSAFFKCCSLSVLSFVNLVLKIRLDDVGAANTVNYETHQRTKKNQHCTQSLWSVCVCFELFVILFNRTNDVLSLMSLSQIEFACSFFALLHCLVCRCAIACVKSLVDFAVSFCMCRL